MLLDRYVISGCFTNIKLMESCCFCLHEIVPADLGAFQFNSDLQSIQLYRAPGGLYIVVMAAEIIYLLFILYYMFLQVKSNMATAVSLISWVFVIHSFIYLNSGICGGFTTETEHVIFRQGSLVCSHECCSSGFEQSNAFFRCFMLCSK